MAAEIVWTRGAESQLQAAYERLEEMQSGSGERFLAALDGALELLKQFPRLAPVYFTEVRRLLIRQSAYGVFYRPHGNRIVILGVLDLRQDSQLLKKYLGLE